ncbi:MAG: LLM class flavin-dependent oxidoreductase [Myxococcota bacterium]
MTDDRAPSIEIFATAPQSTNHPPEEYAKRVADVARWSEEAGCRGILVYSDNRLADPWLVSQIILESTGHLAPLVAVQPVYMHPYTAAKMVSTFGHLHGRRIYLNMVAGGFRNDLIALDDPTPHDDRYVRLTEYTRIILDLLRDDGAVNMEGRYFTVRGLKLSPTLPEELFPGVFVSGSSPAGREAAAALDATPVRYPKPPGEDEGAWSQGRRAGIRVGIIARGDGDEAWRVAHERFPPDRAGQLAQQLAMKVTDSHWHKALADREDGADEQDPYWMFPFKNYKTFCPYLVGSYERVAEEIARYVGLGYSTYILDIPPDPEELEHTGEVFRMAQRRAWL